MCRDIQGCSRAKEKELQPLPGPAGQGHEMAMGRGHGHGYSRTLQDRTDRTGQAWEKQANQSKPSKAKQSTTLNHHTSTPLHSTRLTTHTALHLQLHFATINIPPSTTICIPGYTSSSTSCIPPCSFASAPRSPAKHRPCLLFLLIPILIDRASWLSRDISLLLCRSRHSSLIPSDRTNI